MKFVCADMENIPLPDEIIDVVFQMELFALLQIKIKHLKKFLEF